MRKFFKIFVFMFFLFALLGIASLIPKKYKADVFLNSNKIYTKIAVVSLNGKTYISESDLNNVIHIAAEYDDFKKIGFKDEQTGVFMQLLASMDSRRYIAEEYSILPVEILKEFYLPVDAMNQKKKINVDLDGKKIFITTNDEKISLSPVAAINKGLEELERNFEYRASVEHDISLYETKEYFTIHKSESMATGGTLAKITKDGKLIDVKWQD